jgi:CHAD domain-containing protein
MVDIEQLIEAIKPVESEDTMAEAGRKILLADFVNMLKSEAGSRTGTNIEDVHQMRVATRRMRSAFRLLGEYYKTKPVRPYVRQIKQLARLLGGVRDLDVLIHDLEQACDVLDETGQAEFQPVMEKLDKKRQKAREKLVAYLDSDEYSQFVTNFTAFLTSPGKSAFPVEEGETAPYQVRHVLPLLLHEHLSVVRAYENVLENADDTTLHALRIEFKRLRYATAYFKDVLGSSGGDFIDEIKAIQDHLGRINDINVAVLHLGGLIENEDVTSEGLNTYIATLETEKADLREKFGAVWTRFNSRSVQSKFSNALLTLR